MSLNRRNLLGVATAAAVTNGLLSSRFAAGLAGIGALSAHSAASAATSDYKALVCLFMAGGNDSHNWLVPVDAGSYAEYRSARGDLAMPLQGLSALTRAPRQAVGRQFAMPAELDPLRELYESGQLALVANVGPLERPTTRADFEAGRRLPPRLFSHNDQSSNWQSMGPEGARSGWGGRIGDALVSANPHPIFTTVSAAGNAVFLGGGSVAAYQIGAVGPVGMGGLRDSSTLGSTQVSEALRQTLFAAGSSPFQADLARVNKRSVDAYALMSSTLSTVQVGALPDQTRSLPNGGSLQLSSLPLAQQLRAVAQTIAAGRQLGMRRQVFMVSMAGFDTHGSQKRDQPALMAAVAQSTAWFLSAVRDQGLADAVTLFSASDFGRTLTSNGDGSDHGWGSHHFVAGGAVRGRDIYGRFPTLALGSADEVGSGRLLPSASVTEYGASLARWMGVSNADLATVFPGIGNFGSQDMAFI